MPNPLHGLAAAFATASGDGTSDVTKTLLLETDTLRPKRESLKQCRLRHELCFALQCSCLSFAWHCFGSLWAETANRENFARQVLYMPRGTEHCGIVGNIAVRLRLVRVRMPAIFLFHHQMVCAA